ncbi:MAG TPA: hypothetical protein VL485_20420 [Ktedonobacteraceae bacterium]|jgi:predicted lipoprotein with Yx(FWY)xxD motif|nr:hypothetical protein [Ktedonobacteraceae bacterium]
MAIGIKRGFLALAGLLILALLSSCGAAASPTPTAPTTAQPAATTAPTNSTNDYGSGSTASTPTAATTTDAANVVVKTASATIDGKAMTILTDIKGMTLYYFTLDTASKTACTDGCTQAWPPLLFTGGNPAAASKLQGELEIYPNANGKQVIYNDHPLYTYGGDSAPGQTTGQGVAGKWFVATPDLAKNKP